MIVTDTKAINKKITGILALGILGCLLMGGSDWLMIYGDTAQKGALLWLTEGVAGISPVRNTLAMVLAFPAVMLYGAAMFGMNVFIRENRHKKIYSALTAAGFTPWLALHLFYTMILYLFHWMNGKADELFMSECTYALFNHFAWIVPVSEVIMLLPFFYVFWLSVRGRTVFSKWMALNNPLFYYVLLKLLTLIMPDVPLRLAFINGLMSESMLIWFSVYIIAASVIINKKKK